MKKIARLIVVVIGTMSATSCVSVAGYQRMYLEDPDMALSSKGVEHFEQEAESYREGASGANGGKSGGGCGCN